MRNLTTILMFGGALFAGHAWSSQACAQHGFETAYGNGVHFYYSGEMQKAYDALSAAIQENDRDARALYFRGLAGQSLGYGGEADFRQAAAIEARQGGRSRLVNAALERVQGGARLTIENIRREALLAANQSGPVVPVSGFTRPVNSPEVEATGMAPGAIPVRRPPSPVEDDVPEIAPNQEITPSPFEEPEMPTGDEVEESDGVPFGEDPSPFDAGDESPTDAAPSEAASDDMPFGSESGEVFGNEEPTDVGESPFGGDTTSSPATDAGDSPFGNGEAMEGGDEPFESGDDSDIFGESPDESDAMPRDGLFGDDAPMHIPADAPFGRDGTDAQDSPFGAGEPSSFSESPSPTDEPAVQPAVEPASGDGAVDDPFGI